MIQQMDNTAGLRQKTLHATAIRHKQSAVVILGPSGAGKSALALQLLALGAKLIADDQVTLTCADTEIIASRPDGLPEAIEARGFGLIGITCAAPASLRLVVDLERRATERFMQPNFMDFWGRHVEVMAKIDAAHFPATILVYLEGSGRYETGP